MTPERLQPKRRQYIEHLAAQRIPFGSIEVVPILNELLAEIAALEERCRGLEEKLSGVGYHVGYSEAQEKRIAELEAELTGTRAAADDACMERDMEIVAKDAELERLRTALNNILAALTVCHYCKATLQVSVEPARCIDCPGGCEHHEPPDCQNLNDIVKEAEDALKPRS